jgi:hypothetical protein
MKLTVSMLQSGSNTGGSRHSKTGGFARVGLKMNAMKTAEAMIDILELEHADE